MSASKPVSVTDKDGLRGTLLALPSASAPDAGQAVVQLADGRQVLVPAQMLHAQPDGSYYLPISLTQSGPQRPEPDGTPGQDTIVMPVMVEDFDVQKRQVETGRVRITKRVREREEIIDDLLLQEEIDVQRVPVNRPATGPLPIRYEGDTMIVPLLEEVLVVEKRLMVKEELHISKRQSQVRKPERVILRSEEAAIERIASAEKSADQKKPA